MFTLASCKKTEFRTKLPTDAEWQIVGLNSSSFNFPKGLIIKNVRIVKETTEESGVKGIYIECANTDVSDFIELANNLNIIAEKDLFCPISFESEVLRRNYASAYSINNERYIVSAVRYGAPVEVDGVTMIEKRTLHFSITQETGEIPSETVNPVSLLTRNAMPIDFELKSAGLTYKDIPFPQDLSPAGVDINSQILTNNNKVFIIYSDTSEAIFDTFAEGLYVSFANRKNGFLTEDISLLKTNADTENVFVADYSKDGHNGFSVRLIYIKEDTLKGGVLLIPKSTLIFSIVAIDNYNLTELFYRESIYIKNKGNAIPRNDELNQFGITSTDFITTSSTMPIEWLEFVNAPLKLDIAFSNVSENAFTIMISKFSAMRTISLTDENGVYKTITELKTVSDEKNNFTGYYQYNGSVFKLNIVLFKQPAIDDEFLYPAGTLLFELERNN
jgi:hypothetical protein